MILMSQILMPMILKTRILKSQVAIKRVELVGKFGDEHREASAVIVIAPGHAHGAERLPFTIQRDAADHGLVRERAVAIVVIEMIGSGVIGDEQIGPAVNVVVAPGRAQSVILFGIVNAGFLRDLFKGAVAAVVIEQIGFALHTPGPALHWCAFELAELGR